MRNHAPDPKGTNASRQTPPESLPLPTTQYRRRAWLAFQRAIDPLAAPKPLRIERHH